MKVSEKGADFIARHEGFVSKAYRDPVGVWTIGTGFTNRSRVFSDYWRKLHGREMGAGDIITREQNASLLRKAADEEYGAAVNRHIGTKKQHEYDGATSVCFNCGPGAARWRWARALAAGDADTSAELLKNTAITAGGKRLRGLVRRRRDEAALIAHGDYGSGEAPRRESGRPTGADPQVREYQKKLLALGFAPGKADGVYGRLTRAAVGAFQRRHPDLVEDGILGRATMAQIDRSMEKRAVAKKAAAGGAIIAGSAMTATGTLPSGWIVGAVLAGAALLAVTLGILVYRYRKDL